MEDEERIERKRIALDLSTASLEVIEILLDEADDPALLEEIQKVNMSRPEVLKLLYEHPHTPDKVRDEVARALMLPVKVSREIAEVKKKEMARTTPDMRAQTLTHKVQKLGVGERIRLAMRGSREVRTILLKDTNKVVILAVLDNPKITETEIEMIARSRNVPDDVLRIIARNREWMKSYAVLLALITNPKTPASIAIGFISSLKHKDINLLEKNRNIAEAVRTAAKRLLSAKKR